jgi:hypothetical protein
MKDRGIIYVATKDDRYAAEAFLSATSVKDLMPEIPITLFTNLEDSVYVKDDCFDDVVSINTVQKYANEWSEGLLDRMLCLRHSPYQYTLNLDTDTRVMSAEVLDIFAELDNIDIAMIECETDNSVSRLHYGARMFNVGFILYRKNPKTDQLFKAWSELTAEHFQAASQEKLPDLEYMSHITDEEMRRRLLFVDQVAMVQLLSPDTNVFDLDLKILHESWNYRGSKTNRPLGQNLRVSHHPNLRMALASDIANVAMRYQHNGNKARALELYKSLAERLPGNPDIMNLIAGCGG